MKLCLGTVQFGLKYGVQGNEQPDKRKVFEMLDYAVSKGIIYFDTAPDYGDSEHILGEYFRLTPNNEKKIKIISKLSPKALNQDNKTEWIDVAVSNSKESLQRLGIDKYYAYLLHNASLVYDEEAINVLSEIKNLGFSEKIGVSIYTPEEAMRALESPSIDVIQIPYNVFDRRLDKVEFFRKAKERKVEIFARSSLLQGLVMMDPDNLPDRVSFARDYLNQFLAICDTYNVSPLKAAVGFALAKKEIDHVVFGVDSIDQLKEYIMIADEVIQGSMINQIEGTFVDVDGKLVNPVLWK